MRSGLRRALSNQGTPVPFVPRTARTGGLLQGRQTDDRESALHAMRMGDVFGIVSLNASSVAKIGWHLYRKQPVDGRRRYSSGDLGDDQRIEVVSHAALDLWNHPNDFYTQRAYVEGFQQHLELTGEAYWVLDRMKSSIPLQMFYVMPHRIEPVPDPDKFLAGYIYTGPNGEQVPLQLDEVIGPPSLAMPCPWDPYHGLGWVQSVMVDVNNARNAAAWSNNYFRNNASPSGVIQNPTRWSEPEFDEFTMRWRETHRGVSAAGRVGLLEGGATWVSTQQSMRDMQFAELRQVSGDNIRRAPRVHKHMLGDADDVNRANAETAEETHARWITTDRLDRIKDVLNHRVLPMFGTTGQGVEFDYDDPVTENRELANSELTAKANAAAALVSAGYDPEQVLEAVGLPDMDFGSATPAQEPGPEPASDMDQELQDMVAAVFRRTMMNGVRR